MAPAASVLAIVRHYQFCVLDYALTTSDEYVWCYSERMNWWQNEIPDGVEGAIRSARKKVADGQPLGFDITDFIAAGQKKMKEVAKAREKPPAEAREQNEP